MKTGDILRTFLFMVFFAVGAATLAASVLYNDLIRHYQNKQLLKSTHVTIETLKSLNEDYDALLEQLQKDPNFLKRIASVTLGVEPNEEDTAYPVARPEQLEAARRALTKNLQHQPQERPLPVWLQRCSSNPYRTALFISGAALVLISFVCFGPAKPEPKKQKTPTQ